MKIFIVSYYAELHLSSSAAQNTRLLARSFAEEGHEIRVICAAETAGSERVAGYEIKKIPLSAPSWSSKWLGVWRPDPRVHEIAKDELAAWRPHVVLIGAWKHMTEFALEARRLGIPVVQVVHDYSLICLRQWLLDNSGRLCSGPTSRGKCLECISGSLGVRATLRNKLLSAPLISSVAGFFLGSDYVGNHHVQTGVGSALDHMDDFRRAITLFVAQAPSVVDLLGSAGIAPSRCRFLPQFIGDEKLERYPRPKGSPGIDRPLRLVYVGRWSREKAPEILVDAFSAARTSIDMELWIISRNADPKALEGPRSGVGASPRRIKVVNDATGHRVSRLLARCDLCVVPSRCHELASRVVLEANAQGVPVVASSSVGNRYLIEDRANGRIFPTGDGDALRRCIEDVASELEVIREWSGSVVEPVRRAEWLALASDILDEAVDLGAS